MVLALAVKYLFYEDWEENCRLRKTYLEELERKFEEGSESESVDTNTRHANLYQLQSRVVSRGLIWLLIGCSISRAANLPSDWLFISLVYQI